jgi:hypothetical protein
MGKNILFIGALAGIARNIHKICDFTVLSTIVLMEINVFFYIF